MIVKQQGGIETIVSKLGSNLKVSPCPVDTSSWMSFIQAAARIFCI